MFQPIRIRLLSVTSLTFLMALPLAAQGEAPTPAEHRKPLQVVEQPAAKAPSKVMGGDGVLATWLTIESNNEVAQARLALGKTQNNEVKKFAQSMIDDHTAFALALQPFADAGASGDKGAARVVRGDKAHTLEVDGQKGQPNDASGVRPASPAGFDHVALMRDLGKKCQEIAMKGLNEKTGAAFDQCFLRMQVASHEKSVGALEVFRTYASEQLLPVLDSGHRTLQAHLEHGKALCTQCEAAPKAEIGGNADHK